MTGERVDPVVPRGPRIAWAQPPRHRWKRPVMCHAANQPPWGLHLNRYRSHGQVVGLVLAVPWSRKYLSWVWPVYVTVGAKRRLRWFMEGP